MRLSQVLVFGGGIGRTRFESLLAEQDKSQGDKQTEAEQPQYTKRALAVLITRKPEHADQQQHRQCSAPVLNTSD